MSFLGNIFGSAAKAPIKAIMSGAKELADELFDSKEEKREFLLSVYKEEAGDRNSARKMYMQDSWLQKLFALFYLAAWTGLTIFILHHFIVGGIKLEDWQIALLSGIQGGMSTKLNTIVDFLFGGSAKPVKLEKE